MVKELKLKVHKTQNSIITLFGLSLDNGYIGDTVYVEESVQKVAEYNEITGIFRNPEGFPFILDGSKKVILFPSHFPEYVYDKYHNGEIKDGDSIFAELKIDNAKRLLLNTSFGANGQIPAVGYGMPPLKPILKDGKAIITFSKKVQ